MTKVLAIGFDGCNTNIGEANGVKSWLKKWNPYCVLLVFGLYPELVVNLENYTEMKNDSVAGGLAEGLLSRKNVVCLMALSDVLPVVSTLCRMLQYTSGKDLTIEHFNDYYATA